MEKVQGKYFEKHIYLGDYDKEFREYILSYKFSNNAYMYKTFAKVIIENKKICEILKTYDKIVPIPIHRKRKIERGYNQSELIAKEIVKKIKELKVENVLEKKVNNKAQSTLDKVCRIENVKNVYKIQNKQIIENRKVILFDDIYTTGSTVNECSRILKECRCQRDFSINISKIETKYTKETCLKSFKQEMEEQMEELVESILDYVRADYTDYAVMINR